MQWLQDQAEVAIMNDERTKIRSAVRREHAERYLLIFQIAFFCVTVFGLRVFLQLTGFPQLGNSLRPIAHALLAGLLLFVVVLLPNDFDSCELSLVDFVHLDVVLSRIWAAPRNGNAKGAKQ
jgi:hypothetical protein